MTREEFIATHVIKALAGCQPSYWREKAQDHIDSASAAYDLIVTRCKPTPPADYPAMQGEKGRYDETLPGILER